MIVNCGDTECKYYNPSVKQVIPQEGIDDNGKPEPILITEKKAHPALQQAANICKTLGINLSEFLMTPKSAKDASPTNIIGAMIVIQVIAKLVS